MSWFKAVKEFCIGKKYQLEPFKIWQLMLHGYQMPKTLYPHQIRNSYPQLLPFYERNITPKLVDYEKKRRETLTHYRRRLFWALPIYLLCYFTYALLAASFVTAFWNVNNYILIYFQLILLMIFFACNLIIYAKVFEPVIAYNKHIKRDIFPLLFRLTDNEIIYRPYADSDSAKAFANFGILPSFKKAVHEDFIQTTYRNVAISASEAYLFPIKEEQHNIAFQGILIMIEMKKPFHGLTVLRSRNTEKNDACIKDYIKDNSLHPVILEDPGFTTTFELLSQDQVEARYLFTPTFMQRLKAMELIHTVVSTRISFKDNKMLIAMRSYQDRFEANSIFDVANFENDIIHIYQEMSAIFGIIDTLKLYEDTRL